MRIEHPGNHVVVTDSVAKRRFHIRSQRPLTQNEVKLALTKKSLQTSSGFQDLPGAGSYEIIEVNARDGWEDAE